MSVTKIQRSVFEKELKDKLNFKASAKMSKETCLVKMFKFFDLAGKGTVDQETFAKVCELAGMYIPDDKIAQLFYLYDVDERGDMEYYEFVKQVFGPTSE